MSMRARIARSFLEALAALALIALGAALALAPAPAYADDRGPDRETREEARRAFAAGQAADRRKAWQEAIEHYLRANDLVPHPFAIYNIAANYERLDKLREAATWYERYAAAATDPAERERIQRLLLELTARPAPLTVRSSPDRARVLVDAVPVGTTPYRGTIRGGFHRVTVELDGRREQRDLTVAYAEPVNLELVLRAPTGTLRVTGEPRGAAIQVDGAWAGAIPARLTLPAGSHAIRVTSQGYSPYEASVDVAADREAQVEARLARGGPGAFDAAPGGTTAGARTIRAAYIVGFAGGADARGSGGLGLLEFGIRLNTLDAGVRIGRAGDLTAADVGGRWSLLRSRFTPFLGAGYTIVKGGTGYLITGGLRWDVLQSERAGISVLAETGLRYQSVQPEAEPGEATPPVESGVIVPVMASVVVSYR